MFRRITRRSIAIATAVICAAALPAVALAATSPIPTLKTKLIVPNQQVGSLKLNVGYKTAIREIGTTKGGNCKKLYGCTWGNIGSGALAFYMETQKKGAKPTVVSIQISAPETEENSGAVTYQFTGPLMKLKTSEKIGLGSTMKALRHAYPHLTATSVTKSSGYFVIYGKGSKTLRPDTEFAVESGHVITIDMSSRLLEG